jgi:CRISPR/Cas system-associated protein Cas10 (large subunit of type III CRISPR-Cas system)
MNEYWCNLKQFTDEYEEAAKLNDDVLHDNPYLSMKNIDNYPSHRWTNKDTGEVKEYYAATKNYEHVDPTIEDKHSIHYAGEDRVYLIFKNKYTKEWEFPTGRITFG